MYYSVIWHEIIECEMTFENDLFSRFGLRYCSRLFVLVMEERQERFLLTMVIVSLNPGIIRQRVNTNQLIKIIPHTALKWIWVYISILFIGYTWWPFWVAMKWNDSFEFSLNYTKLTTLALKTYLGKSKIKLAEKLPPVGIESRSLGYWDLILVHSHAYLTKIMFVGLRILVYLYSHALLVSAKSSKSKSQLWTNKSEVKYP